MAITLEIDKDCWKELMLYAKECDSEISGFGRVLHEKNAPLKITEIILLKQECSSVSTKLDDAELAQYLEDDLKNHRSLKVWWHSHDDMKCFWSQTDADTINKLMQWTKYIFSIVINKDGDYMARLDMLRPYNLDIFLEDIEVDMKIIDPIDESILEKVKKSIAEKVTTKAIVHHSYTHGYKEGTYWDPAKQDWVKHKVDIEGEEKKDKYKQETLVRRFYDPIKQCFDCKTYDCESCPLWEDYYKDYEEEVSV